MENTKNSFDVNTAECFPDLHLHLDGSLSLENARSLARLQGLELDLDDSTLRSRLCADKNCKDLNEYLQKFDFPLSLLQTKEGLTQSIKTLCRELKSTGVMYAEIRFAPQLHTKQGLTQEDVVKAAIEGISNADIPCNLILCCMRGLTNKNDNLESVRLAGKYLGLGVAAVDLAGAEALYKNELFQEEVSLAHSLGIPLTLHAGEADGYKSVDSAIKMGAKRIGHGVRSYENKQTLIALSKNDIFLELCPTSNLNTCIFDKLEDYPLNVFLSRGIRFGINTDNISVSDTSIRNEWQRIIDVFSLSDKTIHSILVSTVRASFATEEQKTKMMANINKYFSDIQL